MEVAFYSSTTKIMTVEEISQQTRDNITHRITGWLHNHKPDPQIDRIYAENTVNLIANDVEMFTDYFTRGILNW